jgi:hypothetical protein
MPSSRISWCTRTSYCGRRFSSVRYLRDCVRLAAPNNRLGVGDVHRPQDDPEAGEAASSEEALVARMRANGEKSAATRLEATEKERLRLTVRPCMHVGKGCIQPLKNMTSSN